MKSKSTAKRSDASPGTVPLSGSASPMRKAHLIKAMRYWLNRAEDALNRGYVSHGKIAVAKASETLALLKSEILRG